MAGWQDGDAEHENKCEALLNMGSSAAAHVYGVISVLSFAGHLTEP